jgi:hypothetical protein
LKAKFRKIQTSKQKRSGDKYFKFIPGIKKYHQNIMININFLLFFRYIDFLCRVLTDNELTKIEERAAQAVGTDKGSIKNSCSFSKDGNTFISGHEKLSYLFSVWRMEGDWSLNNQSDY